MRTDERQNLMPKENQSTLQQCLRWMSKPLNRYGAAGMSTGVLMMVLSILLPEDGLTKDSGGYLFLCLAGLLVFGASSGLIIKARHANENMPTLRVDETASDVANVHAIPNSVL